MSTRAPAPGRHCAELAAKQGLEPRAPKHARSLAAARRKPARPHSARLGSAQPCATTRNASDSPRHPRAEVLQQFHQSCRPHRHTQAWLGPESQTSETSSNAPTIMLAEAPHTSSDFEIPRAPLNAISWFSSGSIIRRGRRAGATKVCAVRRILRVRSAPLGAMLRQNRTGARRAQPCRSMNNFCRPPKHLQDIHALAQAATVGRPDSCRALGGFARRNLWQSRRPILLLSKDAPFRTLIT